MTKESKMTNEKIMNRIEKMTANNNIIGAYKAAAKMVGHDSLTKRFDLVRQIMPLEAQGCGSEYIHPGIETYMSGLCATLKIHLAHELTQNEYEMMKKILGL